MRFSRTFLVFCAVAFAFASYLLTTACKEDPRKASVFKTVGVFPTIRCPGTDVYVSWSTAPAAKVEVYINDDKWFTGNPEDTRVITATEVEGLGNEIKVELRIVKSGQRKTFTVKTINSPTTIDRTATFVNQNDAITYEYKVYFPDQSLDPENSDNYDPSLKVLAVSFIEPKDFACRTSSTTIRTAWQLDKDLNTNANLNDGTSYLIDWSSQSTQPELTGLWSLTWMNGPDIGCAPKSAGTGLQPKIRFKIACKGQF